MESGVTKMPEILQYEFMQKAFIVGLFVGVLCPTIGMFLVLRRLSMVGDTLSHVSLTGVLLGLLWNISPLPFALFSRSSQRSCWKN